MKRSIYKDGVEVHMEDLNNTEETKADAIKERQVSFTQHGVTVGLKVTVNSATPSHIDIGADDGGGVAYCENGERIEVETSILDVPLADETIGVYNYVTLKYTETLGDYKQHESDGETYPTRAEETYEVEVLSEADYTVLSLTEKANRVIVAIVQANGEGQALGQSMIQGSLELIEPLTSTALDLDGAWLLRFSTNTLGANQKGTALFKFSYSDGERFMEYQAPADSAYGERVSLSGDGDFLLESYSTEYWCRVRIVVIMLPEVDEDHTTEVTKLYIPPLEGSDELYNTPTATSDDRLHRSKLGAGLPTGTNPHGLTYDDLTGGFTDVTRHQDLMHANGIISPIWEETGGSTALACSIQFGTIQCIQPGEDEYYFIHGLGFTSVESNTFIAWDLNDPPGTYYIAVGTDQLLHKSLTPFNEDDYLVLCSVDVTVSGGNRLLGNLYDLRKFGTTASGNIQDGAITNEKIADGAIRQRHLWADGDDTVIDALVKGENSNADHLHTHDIPDPSDLFYEKPLLYAPQSTEPDEVGSISGANIVGYKNPAIDKEDDDYGDLFPEDVNTVQKAIDQLASLMQVEMGRECPTTQEIMHTSGRMLNMTNVPLPNNHLTGKWADGQEVIEQECTWIVSPAFIWGASAVSVPWMYLCTTFGFGTGGDYPDEDNIDEWQGFFAIWRKWYQLFLKFIKGELFYGRYLITFFFIGIDNATLAVLSILSVWSNYHIVGTHPKGGVTYSDEAQ
jgi:hypothetical protein